MKVKLESEVGLVIHEQEVVFSGRLPDVIRWQGQVFAHHFTHWPHGVTAYRALRVFDMPEPLPQEMLGRDEI